MLIVRTVQDVERLWSVQLRKLVTDRYESILASLEEGDPQPPLIILEPGDTDLDLKLGLGFSVFENRFDGRAFGDPDFAPSFELMEEHDCCTELVFVLSDDGSGVVVFIPNSVDFDPRLAALKERYAIRTQES